MIGATKLIYILTVLSEHFVNGESSLSWILNGWIYQGGYFCQITTFNIFFATVSYRPISQIYIGPYLVQLWRFRRILCNFFVFIYFFYNDILWFPGSIENQENISYLDNCKSSVPVYPDFGWLVLSCSPQTQYPTPRIRDSYYSCCSSSVTEKSPLWC